MKDLKCLNIQNRLQLNEASYVYKKINKKQSNIKTQKFQQNKKIESHSTSTRHDDDIKIEFRNTEFAKKAVQIISAKTWNSLPTCIKNSRSISSFRKNYRTT